MNNHFKFLLQLSVLVPYEGLLRKRSMSPLLFLYFSLTCSLVSFNGIVLSLILSFMLPRLSFILLKSIPTLVPTFSSNYFSYFTLCFFWGGVTFTFQKYPLPFNIFILMFKLFFFTTIETDIFYFIFFTGKRFLKFSIFSLLSWDYKK